MSGTWIKWHKACRSNAEISDELLSTEYPSWSWFDFDTISKNRRNIYEWKQIHWIILDIDFDRTHWNGSPILIGLEGKWIYLRFGISKYHQLTKTDILSNITLLGL